MMWDGLLKESILQFKMRKNIAKAKMNWNMQLEVVSEC